MKKSKYPKGWVKLSKKDKAEWNRAVHSARAVATLPTFFNLASDKDDCGGRFAEMTPHQVVKAAKESARFLKRNYLGSVPRPIYCKNP
jgi:hypothetical protein